MPAEFLVGLVIETTSCSEHFGVPSQNFSEIISFSWCLVDVISRKTISLDQTSVCPLNSYGMDSDKFESLRSAPPLCEVLLELESKISTIIGSLDQTYIITEDCSPLRHLLHPEALRKNILLHRLFFTYFNLQKEYVKAFNKSGEADSYTLKKIASSMGCIDLSHTCKFQHIKIMSKIIHAILDRNHKFRSPDMINKSYEIFPFPQSKDLQDENVVKIRGMPYEATHIEISEFFIGLNICTGGILILLSRKSLKTGEALVLFNNEESCLLAFKRNKLHIASRYIEVLPANANLFKQLSHQYFPDKAANFFESVARLRGLPFRSTADDISEFICKNSQVLQGSKGVLIIENENFLPSGDAFVLFKNEKELDNALLLDRTNLQDRYIEIFKSNIGELLQVACRQEVPNSFGNIIGLDTNAKSRKGFSNDLCSELSNEIVRSEDDCVRLRGLPFSATVDDILDFFCNLSDAIIPRGIHFVFNQKGHPTGECYVQMVSHQSAHAAAQILHRRYIENRYIEVYISSHHHLQMKRYGSFNHSPQMLDPYNRHCNNHIDSARCSPSYLSEDHRFKLKLRGVPYRACKKDISIFFDDYDIAERDIVFLNRGHYSTGEAIVYFPTKERARRALKDKNHKYIGDRYIEIFEAF